MRLRSQIGIAVAAALVIAVAAVAALIAADERAEEIAWISERTSQASLEVARLIAVNNDYARYRQKQALKEWGQPYADIGRTLGSDLWRESPDIAALVQSARERHAGLGKLYEALTDPNLASSPHSASADDLLVRRLLVETQALADVVYQLGSTTTAAARVNRELVRWGTGLFGALIFALIAGLALVVHARLLSPLKRLEGFARQVQSGGRDARVRSGARDELGDLTRALDQMLDALAEETARAKASEERFRRFFEAGMIGMTITSPQGEVVEANDAFCEMLGRSRQDTVGTTWEMFSPQEDVQETLQLRQRLLRGEIEFFRMQRRFVRTDGGMIDAEIAVRTVRAPDGSSRFSVALIQDVTARNLAQQALQARTAELERSNRDLEQFAYLASHDLQEPLRMVASFTQLLQKRYQGRLDADADEYIHFAVDGATRMQHLIRDLLAYARLGSDERELQPVESERALGHALENLRALREETGAKVEAQALPTVLANPTHLVQLFQNLVGNAFKFHGSVPPLVRVSAARAGPLWEFAVADNGIGIAPEHHERVFGLFKRLHARDDYPGTGIGLALCRKIVEQHGGTIRVESAPAGGATFFFTLRAAEAHADADTTVHS